MAVVDESFLAQMSDWRLLCPPSAFPARKAHTEAAISLPHRPTCPSLSISTCVPSSRTMLLPFFQTTPHALMLLPCQPNESNWARMQATLPSRRTCPSLWISTCVLSTLTGTRLALPCAPPCLRTIRYALVSPPCRRNDSNYWALPVGPSAPRNYWPLRKSQPVSPFSP